MRSLIVAVGTGAAIILLSACGTSRPSADGVPDDYRAVPDRQLFFAIGELSQVTEARVDYVDELGTSNSYRGYVTLRPGLTKIEATKAYDHVLVILRHGRWKADVGNVQVQSGDLAIGSVSLNLGADSSYRQTYEQRYGPQTGEKGWPPPFVPN